MSKVSENRIGVHTLRTGQAVNSIVSYVSVTDTADYITSEAVTFDKAFINVPTVIGCHTIEAATRKLVPSVSDITKTGFNVNLYQIASGDVDTDSYYIQTDVIGQN